MFHKLAIHTCIQTEKVSFMNLKMKSKRCALLILSLCFCLITGNWAGLSGQEEKKRKLPVDVRVKRVILQYESEVSFLVPEGEFNASFEKKFGHFTSLTFARYNYLRGEMGFKSQNIFTRYSIVPQLVVYDKLKFVSLFDEDHVWRREQAMQLGTRFLFPAIGNTLTSLNFVRYSYPSLQDVRSLYSQRVFKASQSFGADVDSLSFLGFSHSGVFNVQIDKAFAVGGSRLSFWQLHVKSQGSSDSRWVGFEGTINWITLLEGQTAPLRYLGGRDRLSAYKTNQFQGPNIFYSGIRTLFHLSRGYKDAFSNFGFRELNFVVHLEAGQAGYARDLRLVNSFYSSIGGGFEVLSLYKKKSPFHVFFRVYKGLSLTRPTRLYVGFKI